jgi:phosphopantothenoylcysteine decarboxylase/phosphopantothenate--cysteine ligase
VTTSSSKKRAFKGANSPKVDIRGKHIIVGVSGGIAAYKIPELIRLLVKQGAEVRVTVTRHALEFVTELTLQTVSGHKVYSDVFGAINEHATEHISLPEWADIMIVAPATANVLGKFAAGIADDALTTTFSSCAARKPIVLAPAMNDKMWENPATQSAIRTLRSWQGIHVIEPAEGVLACGTSGKGRMPEVEILAEQVKAALSKKTMQGKRVLITAGATIEKIDPVRYISNFSTGKMGYAIARECLRRGAEVTLISGKTQLTIEGYEGLQKTDIESAQEMFEASREAFANADIAIFTAAVADYSPAKPATEKIKRQEENTTLLLHANTDIAGELSRSKRAGQMTIGFALETNDEEANAQKKLQKKGLDYIVMNSLQDKDAGFGVDTNKVTLYGINGIKKDSPLESKEAVSRWLLDALGY